MIDKENAVIIGTAVDELIRHHPSLKGPVFDSLQSTLSRIESLGASYVPPADIKRWYQLMATPVVSVSDDDVEMQDEGSDNIGSRQNSPVALQSESIEEDAEEDGNKSHDNTVVSYIDAIGRVSYQHFLHDMCTYQFQFLEGFFQHPPHCKDFVTTTDGLQRFGRLTGLPCLPYDFANSVASDSMVQVLRTMTEVATNETLLHLSEIVKTSLNETKFFWNPVNEPSKLLSFVDLMGMFSYDFLKSSLIASSSQLQKVKWPTSNSAVLSSCIYELLYFQTFLLLLDNPKEERQSDFYKP